MTATYEIIDPAFARMVDTNTPPEAIARGCTWTEGPVCLNGTLYFNDIPNKRMISCEHGGRRAIRRLDPEDPTAVELIVDSDQRNRRQHRVLRRAGRHGHVHHRLGQGLACPLVARGCSTNNRI